MTLLKFTKGLRPPPGAAAASRAKGEAMTRIRRADRIRVGWCKDGNVHIEMLDASGRILARASMERAGALIFASDIVDVEIAARGEAAGEGKAGKH